MAETVAGFDWDEGNREKCAKHGVSIEEIEDLFIRSVTIRADLAHSHAERRQRAVGRTASGRYVFLVFTIRERDGKRLLRPISARFMHRKEIRRYEEQTSEEIPPTQNGRGS
jgi:uncharacterized DUF497 family protein